jgi:hypothetical protein
MRYKNDLCIAGNQVEVVAIGTAMCDRITPAGSCYQKTGNRIISINNHLFHFLNYYNGQK